MYRHILVPLDGSQLAEQVLPHVQSIVNRNKETCITLLRSVQPDYIPAVEFDILYIDIAAEVRAAQEYLDQIALPLRAEGYHVMTEVSNESPAESIVAFAQRQGIDLIAIATHGRSGISRWLFGSVTQKVIEAAPVPVLVVRPRSV